MPQWDKCLNINGYWYVKSANHVPRIHWSQEVLSIRVFVTLLFETPVYIVNISGWLFWLQAPDVMAYVKKKAELHELKQAVRVWSHRKKIQQTTLISSKRLLHKLTVNSLQSPRCAKHVGLSQYISDGKWRFGNRLVWKKQFMDYVHYQFSSYND